ncbi:hypothetical protein BOTBODRAFT_178532 [Botryobasidium botryosum FD-172 SS1]|uniref:Ubiquitin-like protease family profile domain-containing protein n=1 Tax=Botryobasidium botryosum (strain FD-172 SS1) TaxID=930990 RepID=A0A067M345_BOTB1|nr:hypothetical protein BOTBODRAFT_178532 [Botryobasidium botryosum FD-172 SS1]
MSVLNAPVSHFGILPDLVGPYLPQLELPIVAFLAFECPRLPDSSFSPDFPAKSALPPNIDLTTENLRRHVITPALCDVQRLLAGGIPVAGSIVVARSEPWDSTENLRLPTSALRVWRVIMETQEVRAVWLGALVHLGPDMCTVSMRVRKLLGVLPWGGRALGSPAEPAITALTRFIDPKAWLSDEEMSQQAHLLRQSHVSALATRGGCIMEPFFWNSVLNAYRFRKGRPYCAENYMFLTRIGSGIGSGETKFLAGAMFVRRNHWVAYVINIESEKILIGDSFGGEISDEEKGAWIWWLGNHSDLQFSLGRLPITRQLNSLSCGVLAHNAIQHFVDPIGFSLLIGQDSINLARLKTFVALGDLHLSSQDAQIMPQISDIWEDHFSLAGVSVDTEPGATQLSSSPLPPSPLPPNPSPTAAKPKQATLNSFFKPLVRGSAEWTQQFKDQSARAAAAREERQETLRLQEECVAVKKREAAHLRKQASCKRKWAEEAKNDLKPPLDIKSDDPDPLDDANWAEVSRPCRGIVEEWKVLVKEPHKGGRRPTNAGILTAYPEVRNLIDTQITKMRGSGALLSLITIRGFMVGILQHFCPEVFELQTKSGRQKFRCTDSFKVPANAEQRILKLVIKRAAHADIVNETRAKKELLFLLLK